MTVCSTEQMSPKDRCGQSNRPARHEKRSTLENVMKRMLINATQPEELRVAL